MRRRPSRLHKYRIITIAIPKVPIYAYGYSGDDGFNAPSAPTFFRLLESGDKRIIESGDYRIIE